MRTADQIPGYRLTSLPPVYQFTHLQSRWAWSTAGVFLIMHEGLPHWFATNGYSAMLTPALVLGDEGPGLFEISVPQRCYISGHIKALFQHVKGSDVIYELETGNLISQDGIVIVPPYVREVDPGEDPEPVRLPDIERVFAGEPSAQERFDFDWNFIAGVRAAFKAHNKEAYLVMTSLEGNRVLLEIDKPYPGKVLVAMQGAVEAWKADDQPADQPTLSEAAVDFVADAIQPGEDMTITVSSGDTSVTITPETAKKARRLRQNLRLGRQADA